MTSAIAFIQWDNYGKGSDGRGYFESQPLTFNSRQERLHLLAPDDHLWLVSRCPDDQQYYFVGVLHIASLQLNSPDSPLAQAFGGFAVVADHSRSHDLGKQFPAEGLLRAFEFDSRKPIQFGASIGRSLLTIRVLAQTDEYALNLALQQVLHDGRKPADPPFGLWTKCDAVFADYFLTNWRARREPVAFMLYDSPPTLAKGAPIFIHSDKKMRLLATLRRSEYVAGYKPTVEASERMSERERFWSSYRARTINPPAKEEFDAFWDAQHGVRSMFVMDNVREFPSPLTFKMYGRALEWGYPMGVGYRYLSFSQSVLLLRQAELSDDQFKLYLSSTS